MKQKHQTKLIACSAALAVSVSAHAGLGGLNVKSHLNHPFSASVTVSGNEAQSLLNGGKVSISNSSLKTSIRPDGDKVVVQIRSAAPIREPILTFQLGVGAQTREYTAMLDPAGYDSTLPATKTFEQNPNVATDSQSARERIRREVQRHAAAPARPSNRPSAAGRSAQAATASKTQAAAPLFGQKYRIRSGETLNQIAARLRVSGMSTEQVAQVLRSANPHAFINQQADRLLSGSYLTIPQRSAFGAQNPSQAAESSGNSAAAPKVTPPPVPEATPAAASEAAAPMAPPSAVSEVVASDVLPEPDLSQASAIPPAVESLAVSDTADALPAQASSAEPAANAEDSASGVLSWRNMILAGGVALLVILLGLRQREKRRTVARPNSRSPESVSTPTADPAEWNRDLQKQSPFAAAAATLASAAGQPSETTAAVVNDKYSDDDFDDDDIVFTSVSDETDDEGLSAVPAAADASSSVNATTQTAEPSKLETLEWQAQNILQKLPPLSEGAEADDLEHGITDGQSSEWSQGLDFELPAHGVAHPSASSEAVAKPAETAPTEGDGLADDALLGKPWHAFSENDDEELFPSETEQSHADTVTASHTADKPLEFVAASVAESGQSEPAGQAGSSYQSVVADETLPETMWNYFPENDYHDLFPTETEHTQADTAAAQDSTPVDVAVNAEVSQAESSDNSAAEEALPEGVWNYFPENDYSDLFPPKTEQGHEDAAAVSERQNASADLVGHSTAASGDQEAVSESVEDQDQELSNDWQHRGVDEEDDDSMAWQNLELKEPLDAFADNTSLHPAETGLTAHADAAQSSNSSNTPLDVRCDLAQMYIEIGDIQSARETLQALLNDPDASVSAKAQTMLADLNTKNPPKLK